MVKKAVVVAPATLVNNWEKEVKKWVGAERMRAMVLSSQVGGFVGGFVDFSDFASWLSRLVGVGSWLAMDD